MSNQCCPVCKSDSYLNPEIVIYISPCFHRLCESCIFRIFNQGQAPCPECGTLLRRINYISPTFEDINVERECRIRKLLNRAFLRGTEEFQENELPDYNDYLEAFEDLVFEVLDYKTETQLKEKIKEIQELGHKSVLNPRTKLITGSSDGTEHPRKRSIEDSDSEENKIQQISLYKDYFDPSTLPRIGVELKDTIICPSNYIKENLAAGLSIKTIISMAVASLDDCVV